MTKRKGLSVIICLSMVISLMCANVVMADETEEEQHYKIGFSIQDGSQPFHATIRDEVQARVEENGDTFVTADPARDQQLQIDQIEDMITQGIDVLIMDPVQNDGVLPALEACKDAGVPVIAYDERPVDEDYIVTYCASDDYEAGYIVGEYVMDQLDEGAKIGIMYNAHSDSIVNRTAGFEDAVGDYFEVVHGDIGDDSSMILGDCEDLIQANPDLAAIFGPYEGFSTTAAAVVASSDLGDSIQVYGVDGSPAEKASIVDGQMVATAAQSPKGIADMTVDVAYDFLAGEEVEPEYLIDPFIIDASNVEEYGTEDWQ